MAGCAIAVSGALPAAAQDYPFCIKGCDYNNALGDCSFTSLAQCQATASGRPAYCAANPYYKARAELPPGRSKMSARNR
jgi:hypothetical protein